MPIVIVDSKIGVHAFKKPLILSFNIYLSLDNIYNLPAIINLDKLFISRLN